MRADLAETSSPYVSPAFSTFLFLSFDVMPFSLNGSYLKKYISFIENS